MLYLVGQFPYRFGATVVPLARYASLSGYVDVAQEQGLDPARLMTLVGLDPAGLARPDNWVPAAALSRLLELSAAESGCPDFGLRLAEHRALSALGPLSLVLRDEPAVRPALELLIRYEHSYNEAVRMRLSESNGLATVKLWFEYGEPVASRQADELGVAVLHSILGEFLGAEWQPLTTCFTHPGPTDRTTHHRLLGQRLHFDHEFNGVVMYSRELDTAISSTPHRSPAVEEFLNSLGTPRGQSTGDHVAEIIELLLPTGRCTASQVARMLGVDRRTLHRHLTRSSESVSSLVDSTRAGLAERYLASDRHNLTAISELLGFAAPSAFSRWFRQRFGVSPSEWRDSRGVLPGSDRPPPG